MRTLVAYASKKGSTADLARRIAGELGGLGTCGVVDLVDVSSRAGVEVDITPYDMVVLGAPSYMGSWNKAATKWARNNEALLSGRRVALFETGLSKDELSMRTAVPSLAERAAVVAKIGGAIRWDSLNILERAVIKMAVGKNGDTDTTDETVLRSFIDTIKKA